MPNEANDSSVAQRNLSALPLSEPTWVYISVFILTLPILLLFLLLDGGSPYDDDGNSYGY